MMFKYASVVSLVFLFACATERRGPSSSPSSSPPSDAGSVVDLSQDLVVVTGVDAGKPTENLIPNGDFEQGNVQFSSDYLFQPATNFQEGEYTVGTNAQAFNNGLVASGDHTTGTGKMFIGNGKGTADRVWFLTTPIAVTPSTQYYFEAWVMNLCCRPGAGYGDGTMPVGPSELSFYANDVLLGTRTSSKIGLWEGLSTTWSSGSATTVTLKVVNANTAIQGNDFAIDDVFLGTETTIY